MQQAASRSSDRADAQADDVMRAEIFDMLAEAGLGQGLGFEWLIDRFTGTREQNQ